MAEDIDKYQTAPRAGNSVELESCLRDYRYNESKGKVGIVFNPDKDSEIIGLTTDILTTPDGNKSFRIDIIRRPSQALTKHYDVDDSPPIFSAPHPVVEAVKAATGESIEYTEWYTGAQFSLAAAVALGKIDKLLENRELSTNPKIRTAIVEQLAELTKQINPELSPETLIDGESMSRTSIQSNNTVIGI